MSQDTELVKAIKTWLSSCSKPKQRGISNDMLDSWIRDFIHEKAMQVLVREQTIEFWNGVKRDLIKRYYELGSKGEVNLFFKVDSVIAEYSSTEPANALTQ